ncbi:MAG: cysteine hydrolase [Tenericutes bacterium HGW-Tenericutes-1]|jgi:nicotinamidase-related amidase|nr:MAG: cysteine hydrolase [Tenericutes bacterium HGW-Tenericutes-1]PKM57009.1 MAG: cysteine hydrolase [Firmicutes bacterium HGW-Firmicutes-3]
MNKTALIVVDMIYDFTNPEGKVYYPQNQKVIYHIIDLVREARQSNCQIIYIQHTVTKEMLANNIKKTRECCVEGTGGNNIDERLEVQPNDWIIKKHKYSAFFETPLNHLLKKNDITQLIVVGTKTNNCVYATILDAYNHDYITYVVKECVGTSDITTNEIYLRDIGKYLGEVRSMDEIKVLLRAGVL